MIIGLTGYARSGKDTVAQHLVEHYGFHRHAFADRLKQGLQAMLGLTDEQLHGELKETVDPFWHRSPREILQYVGTNLLRDRFDTNIWLKLVERDILLHPQHDWAISDVRFPNEADMVYRLGGVVWKLDRPGAHASGGIPKHSSEIGVDKIIPTAVIPNHGTLDDLYNTVDILCRHTFTKERMERPLSPSSELQRSPSGYVRTPVSPFVA